MKSSPFRYDTRELGRRPGSMRTERIEVPAPDGWGLGVVQVPPGAPVVIDARFESVMDGVLLTADIDVPVAAECGRCLDPLESELTVTVQELYAYEPDPEDAESLILDGDTLDLEPVVRDAVVLALPFNPLCDLDCPGLCATCGARLADVEPDHAHDDLDPRWAALALLKDSVAKSTTNEEN